MASPGLHHGPADRGAPSPKSTTKGLSSGVRGVMQFLGVPVGAWPRARSAAAAQRFRFWLVTALSLLLLFGLVRSTKRGPAGASTLSITGAPCPVDYPRMTVEAIQAGARPYLFGGRPPSCPACASTEFVAQLCQFNSTGNGLCDRYKVDLLVKEQLSLGFNSLLTFTPCDLFSLVRGRLLFFTGDSQTQDFIKAMQCFTFAMTDLGWHVMDEEGRLEAARQSGFMWHDSRGCVLLPANTRFCFKRCDDYACIVNEVIPLLKKIGKSEDFLIANFGLHFSPDYEGELRNLSSKVEQLRRQGSFPHLLWKDTPPQHFGTYFGEYPQNAGKPPFLCKAVGLEYKPEGEAKWLLQRDHSIKVLYPEWEEIARGGWRNALANRVMMEAGVPIIHTWNDTVALHDYHRDNGAGHECTHFCLPSAPQMWVFALYETLQRTLGIPQTSRKQP